VHSHLGAVTKTKGVAKECMTANGRVSVANGIDKESGCFVGSVKSAGSVAQKHKCASAVFSSEALNRSALAPTPVLNWLVALALNERKPTAVLNPPVVRVGSAFCPSAVFPPAYRPSGGGRLRVPALASRNR
jgi:hypothetical protein